MDRWAKARDELLGQIAQFLIEKKEFLVTAESCTGGLLSSFITEIPGASQWFERGYITYSNTAKTQMLAVPDKMCLHGEVVSTKVALKMAQGALQNSQADIAVATTGIAGPDGGSITKPVGTVCLGWAYQMRHFYSIRAQLSGDRQSIRQQTCLLALQGILDMLNQQA